MVFKTVVPEAWVFVLGWRDCLPLSVGALGAYTGQIARLYDAGAVFLHHQA